MVMIVTEGMIMGADTTRATTMIKAEAEGTIAETMIMAMTAITVEIVMTGMTDSFGSCGGL
ncbi:hypothetical protein [Pseudomonas sp. MWU15-20650]|uniref:hypothetical protein n=1 Tax=Pseudomonas sp. MWU15-20650 TaxID=2933107 RepID=UPI0032C3DBF1